MRYSELNKIKYCRNNLQEVKQIIDTKVKTNKPYENCLGKFYTSFYSPKIIQTLIFFHES